MTALALTFAALTSVPKGPVKYLQGQEVLNRRGVSFLSWITFSYGFLHRASANRLAQKLSLQDVPVVDCKLRTRTLRAAFGDTLHVTRLWLRLVRFCFRPLLLHWALVLLRAASEFGCRYALFKFLSRLDTISNPAADKTTWA